MLHAAFVRSPHAHARIAAHPHRRGRGGCPGVARVFTFADLERWMKPLPLFGAIPPGLAARVALQHEAGRTSSRCAGTSARYVGEIVAMVVADSRALAEDAAELIEVDYEPLPAVADMEAAARARRARAPPGLGRQRRGRRSRTASATSRRAFREADVAGARALLHPALRRHAARDARRGRAVGPRATAALTTWNSTQVVHFVQQGLVAALGLPPHKIRVIAPDVGGGFGTKATGYRGGRAGPRRGDRWRAAR